MTPEQVDELKANLLLKPLNNAQELRDWMTVFLGITFPDGFVYPSSTHGPVEAMWRIYELMKTGDSRYVPQITMLASRDSFKTLSAAAIEVLCMMHFRIAVAHMAAIKSQSEKAIEYVNSFFRKLSPYLVMNGWKKISDNKSRIEWLTETGQNVYLRIVIATIAGANSEHVPMLFIDEVDVVQDPRALKEAKMIPSVYGKYFPLTTYLSTRKFAGGLMEKTIKETINAGGEVLRWNIIDVCERISLEEAESDKPKVTRYLSRSLPMQNLSPEEWMRYPEEKRVDFEKFEAYAGIAEHKMLPVMKNYLVDRPQRDHGNLFKPLIAVHNNFKQTAPDWAEAQLLCDKPSSSGLVYPRFDEIQNVLSIEEALERLLGESPEVVSFAYLKQQLLDLGTTIIGGGDFGFTDYTSIPILGLFPNGDVWLLTNYTMDKMELDDIVKICFEYQDEWNVQKWIMEQAYPAYLKTLSKQTKQVRFKKVVEDGISALQGKIVDSNNVRKFYIIDVPENKPFINAFGEYRWKLDGKGEIIEGKPHHDKDGVSDMMDGLRYPMQVLFTRGKKPIVVTTGEDKKTFDSTKASDREAVVKSANNQLMNGKIKELATTRTVNPDDEKKKRNKRIFWMS